MNILDFFPDGALKYVASTNGGEWAGSCPWCEGDDRFRVWPQHTIGIGGRYWCRACKKNGDAFQLLKELGGLKFRDACRVLGVRSSLNLQSADAQLPTAARGSEVPNPVLSPRTWQERAAWFVADCAERMVPESRGLTYALSRHLTLKTVTELGIGWNPSDRYEKRSEWGLSTEEDSQGKPKIVWLPTGLVIPSRSSAGVVGIKIRRSKWHPEDDRPKYIGVPGTTLGLSLRKGSARPVVVVESEIDAALIWQEAGDLVDALALGTASRTPDAETMAYLDASPLVLVSLDYDEAGIKATKKWHKYGNAKLWPVAMGKDVGDMAGTPGLVREWITLGLQSLLTNNA